MIQYGHFNPLSGLPEKPENYHTVTIKLSAYGNQPHVSLNQDGQKCDKRSAGSFRTLPVLAQSAPSCFGLLSLAGRYTAERLEAARRRALATGAHSRRSVLAISTIAL